MARIGLVGGSYTSQSPNADDQMTMNFYSESIESQGGKAASALYPTPGTIVFCTLPDTPVRGQIFTAGRSFAVGGATFCETTGGVVTNYGVVSNDSKTVSMAAGITQILIASAGVCYVFNLTTNVLTPIPPATLTNILKVGYSDGYFVALPIASETLQASALLDATTWPGASVSTANVFVDTFLSMLIDHREIWLFGSARSQVYYDSGNTPFPFDVVPGGMIEQGIVAGNSPVRLDNSVFWLGGDERGSGIAWRAQGYTPTRVSNHAVEFAWQGYSTISDAIGYSYQDQGHSFWVLYFPTANHTWVYDVATGQWHERGLWLDESGIFTAHRSQNHIFANGQHLVGDWGSGNIYQMSINFLTDFGTEIRRVRRCPIVSIENEWVRHDRLQIDLETGLGPIPAFTLPSTSPTNYVLADSGAHNWYVLMLDAGMLQQVAAPAGLTPTTIFLNDSVLPSTSWQITVSLLGILVTTGVAFNATYPNLLQIASTPSGLQYSVQVNSGILQNVQGVNPTIGPQINLRWSDDSGHTWSNLYNVDAGQAGKFITRAIWRRLGRSRNRVYEVSVSDPIPWRLLEADLKATPGFEPSERIVKQYAKVT